MIQELTLPEIATSDRHSMKRGPFGGALKKDIFVDEGYVVYEQQHAIYKRFNDVRYYIDESKYKELVAFKVEEGDLIISCSGTIGKIAEVPKGFKPGIINQALLKLTLDQSKVLNKYFIYLFEGEEIQNQLFNLSHGTGLKNFPPMSVVKSIKFPLPPLDQQKKIAAILDAADAYRQKTKALIEKYDELTQSLFLDMFGDPVRNPMRWKMVNFSDVGKLDRGKSKHRPRNAPELLGGIHPLIQTGNLANCGVYLKEYTSTYSDIGLAQSKKWPSGTLCITIAANIAKTGILTFDACFPDSVVGFIPNQKTNNLYTLFWLSFLQKILEETAPESAQKNINLGILRALDFPLPPIELQNQFAERVQAIEVQKAQAQASLAQAEDLFNSLLQKAFKGELS